jgi:hypothetical protein
MRLCDRCGRYGALVLLSVMASLVIGRPASAGAKPATGLAILVISSDDVAGAGALEEFLLDRLGSNGVYPVADPQRVRAAAAMAGLDRRTAFDRSELVNVGRMLGCRWVVWVKVADRGVEYKKGLSIPHLFTRRKAVSRMLVDARIVDVLTTELVASHRWSLDESGAGSYQVAEDVMQDPLYNNSSSQLFQDGRRLEVDAARNISIWFKSYVGQAPDPPVHGEQEKSPGRGPFVIDGNSEVK